VLSKNLFKPRFAISYCDIMELTKQEKWAAFLIIVVFLGFLYFMVV